MRFIYHDIEFLKKKKILKQLYNKVSIILYHIL